MQTSARATFSDSSSSTVDLAVDSEKLYNTVSDLVERDTLDIAPFVTSWHPLLDSSGQMDPNFGLKIERTLKDILKQDAFLNHRIRDLAGLLASKGGQNRFDGRLLERMQKCVTDALAIGPASPVDYLSPLKQIAEAQGSLHIATLNYDLTVESALDKSAVGWSDGISDAAQQAKGKLDFGASAVEISKLHGSLSWYEHHSQRSIIVREPEIGPGWPRPRNAILFGGRNKLTVRWPFFNLLWDWRQRLDSTTTLCAVGYSFRDDHVNAIVLNWLGSDARRRLVVVDPGFPQRREIRHHVLDAYYQTNSNESRSHWANGGDPDGAQNLDGPPELPQLVIKRCGAEQGLREIASEYF